VLALATERWQAAGVFMNKVLVIEDDEAVRQFIVAGLRMKGYEMTEAVHGRLGVEVAKAQPPDLILCDIQMPEMDGYETLRALRSHPATATIPFVFLTGAADRSDVRLGMELGADDYLTKPFTLSELQATVAARIQKQSELLKRSEEKLEELRANISLGLPHELLTPLNGILGYAAVLLEDSNELTRDEILECARSVDASARRLQRLIENFLIYGQIEVVLKTAERAASLRPGQPIETSALVGTAAMGVASRLGRGADLEMAAVRGMVAMRVEYFSKIVEELTDNAFKFSPSGTQVRVISGEEAGRYRLRIEDAGRGMTAQQVRDIGAHMQFERRLYEQQGAGLGLVISRRLAELHGGELRVESEPGRGTAVTVLI